MKTTTSLRKPYDDLTGRKFGDLTVLEYAEHREGASRGACVGRVLVPFWKCRCECGNFIDRNGRLLKRGRYISCGCRSHGMHANPNRLPQVKTRRQAAWSVFKGYRISARERKLEWRLTEDQFFSLITQPCHYSGAAPKKLIRTREGDFFWNGVDRKDNSVGYILDNCVPCSDFANTAKLARSYDDFKVWLKQVAAFQNSMVEI